MIQFSKIITGVLLCLAGYTTLFSQNYYFPTENAIWEENGTSLIGNFIKYHFLCGDTSIAEVDYQKVYYADYRYVGDSLEAQNELLYVGALRVEESKVFFVDNFGEPEEVLLYDFALEEEASVNLPSTTVGQDNMYQVSSVDSVMINGAMRRRLLLENQSDQSLDIWIEGIGSVTYGLLDRGLGLIFDYGSSLRCFKDDNLEFTFTVSGKEPCLFVIDEACQLLPSATPDIRIPAFKIYPNPSDGRVRITLPDTQVSNIQVTITDLQGKGWGRLPFGDGWVDLKHLPAGVYQIRLWEHDQPISYGQRIVIQ